MLVFITYFLIFWYIISICLTEEWIVALELYPGFSLYRGLYEFSQYASRGSGMKWQDISDSGMGEVLCIMSIEWFLALIIAFYIDQVFSSGKHPFFFLNPSKKSSSIPSKPTVQRMDSKKVSIDMGKIDVSQEVCLTSHIFGLSMCSLMLTLNELINRGKRCNN